MPDQTPDLVALADQVKFLSGDLNRRFELLNSRIDELGSGITQLNSRIDALSTSRKVPLPFKPALGGDWLDGTTSPRIISDGPPGNVRVGGSMTVVPQAPLQDWSIPSIGTHLRRSTVWRGHSEYLAHEARYQRE